MKELESIRKLYRPIQPSVRLDNDKVHYAEIQPEKALDSFVYCYWQLQSTNKLDEPYLYRVVSDGCIDLFFETENPANCFLMGFSKKYVEFEIGKTFNYFGIRFYPSAFPLIFDVSAKLLSNKYQLLSNFLPEFAIWFAQLKSQVYTIDTLVEALNKKIISIALHRVISGDLRFFNAIEKILQCNGFLNIEKELNLGLSPRQLRRIFNYYIGATPKVFSNVVRFQYILNARPSKQSLKSDKIYYDVGFFDQAHFIHSFKLFYGVTPSQAFE